MSDEENETDSEEQREPWDKRDDESSKAYNAFCIYRNLGPESRTLDKTREALGRPSGYNRWLEEWSSKFDWVERAEAWDQHVEEKAREKVMDEQIDDIERAVKRHKNLAQGMQKIAYDYIQYYRSLDGEEKIKFLKNIDPQELSMILKRVVPLEREAFDKPGEIKENRGDNLGQLLEDVWDKRIRQEDE